MKQSWVTHKETTRHHTWMAHISDLVEHQNGIEYLKIVREILWSQTVEEQ